MVLRRDEVHEKQFGRRLRIVVSAAFISAILILIYLISYSFTNLDPLITLALIVVLLIVIGIAIFSVDVAFYREIQ